MIIYSYDRNIIATKKDTTTICILLNSKEILLFYKCYTETEGEVLTYNTTSELLNLINKLLY